MPAISLTQSESHLKKATRFMLSEAAVLGWPLLPRAFYIGNYPFNLYIALTRKCNSNCIFCTYQFFTKADKAHMSEDVFERVLEQIRQLQIKSVMLSPNIGEPTIAPDFLGKLARLREAGVEFIEMTSNALYFNKIGLEQLLENGPDKINISFAGFDKEMYERDYRVYRYEETRDNILGLLRINHERGRPRTISLWLRGDKPIEELMAAPEMETVRRFAHEITAMTEVDNMGGLIKAEDLPRGYKIQAEKRAMSRRPCSMLFDLTIHPDGSINLCSCRNIWTDKDMLVGNLNDMSLLEAHSKIAGVLASWEQGHIPATCQNCSMYCDPALGLAGRVRAVRKANKNQAHPVLNQPS